MGIISFVNLLFTIYSWIIVGRCILSFIPHNPNHSLIQWFYTLTEPVLQPIRRFLPATMGIDFSPIIVIIALALLRRLVNDLLIMIVF